MGVTWKRFTNLGRNWDFGSVDWAASAPKTIIAAKHETSPPGEVYVTTDGGITWNKLSIHLGDSRNRISMVGALGGGTLIYSKGEGIHRSTDTGATWTKVSAANPQTRIPVLFHGAHYLGDRDRPARQQGQGRDLAAAGSGGSTSGRVPSLAATRRRWWSSARTASSSRRTPEKPGRARPASSRRKRASVFTPNWFGCYAWDPVNHVLYASSMGNPVYRLDL